MLRRCLSILPTTSHPVVPRRFVSSMGEFFDDPANFGQPELRPNKRPGRSWTADELRLKSNVDLHKLWFVCLKERNMLLTMKRAHNAYARYLPNPERIDRVDETMAAIKEVIDERDEAVYRLETGYGARPDKRTITSFMGFTYQEEAKEHLEPPNSERKQYEVPYLDDDAYMMQKLWAEKEHMKELERADEQNLMNIRTPNMRRFKRGGPRYFNR